jgi:hypothetical protein
MIAPDAYQAVIATPIGMIGIRMAGEAVGELDFLPADAPERAPADVVTHSRRGSVARVFPRSSRPGHGGVGA